MKNGNKKPDHTIKLGRDNLIGAEGETRTRTSIRHTPLKRACLPIPPLRRRFVLILNCSKNCQYIISTVCYFFSAGATGTVASVGAGATEESCAGCAGALTALGITVCDSGEP